MQVSPNVLALAQGLVAAAQPQLLISQAGATDGHRQPLRRDVAQFATIVSRAVPAARPTRSRGRERTCAELRRAVRNSTTWHPGAAESRHVLGFSRLWRPGWPYGRGSASALALQPGRRRARPRLGVAGPAAFPGQRADRETGRLRPISDGTVELCDAAAAGTAAAAAAQPAETHAPRTLRLLRRLPPAWLPRAARRAGCAHRASCESARGEVAQPRSE